MRVGVDKRRRDDEVLWDSGVGPDLSDGLSLHHQLDAKLKLAVDDDSIRSKDQSGVCQAC